MECINAGVQDPELFNTIVGRLETQFRLLAQNVDERIQALNLRIFQAVRADLDILRSENVLDEAEQNPEFTRNLRMEVNGAKGKLEAIRRALQAANAS